MQVCQLTADLLVAVSWLEQEEQHGTVLEGLAIGPEVNQSLGLMATTFHSDRAEAICDHSLVA